MQSSFTALNYASTTHKINTECTDPTKCMTGHTVHLMCHNILGVDCIIIIIIIIIIISSSSSSSEFLTSQLQLGNIHLPWDM